MVRWLALCVALNSAPMAQAHPHVFIDVVLRFMGDDQGRLTGVEVTWSYDDFFSLLVLEDRGLDADGDMILSEDERASLMGFDLEQWEPGFEGALFLHDDGQKVPLGPPEATHVEMQGGRIVTKHVRPVSLSNPHGLTVRAYDPSYYGALELIDVSGLPKDCSARIIDADTEAADAKVNELGGVGMEAVYDEVQVGIFYADEARIACAPSS